MCPGCGDFYGLRDAAALHDVFLEEHGVREALYCCVGEESEWRVRYLRSGRRGAAYKANPCRAILDLEQSSASFLKAFQVLYSMCMCSPMLYSQCQCGVCVCGASSAAAAGVHTWMHSGVNEEVRTRSSTLRSEISLTASRAWSAPQDSDISVMLCDKLSRSVQKEKLWFGNEMADAEETPVYKIRPHRIDRHRQYWRSPTEPGYDALNDVPQTQVRVRRSRYMA